jgi:hypothetical protein
VQVKAQLSHTQWTQMLTRLKDVAPHAAARAINRSIASGKTAGERAVARDLKLKVSEVRRYVRLQEASKFKLVARIFASAKRLPVSVFNPRQGRRGVTARTAQGTYPGAFIARLRSGHTGVFMRKLPTRSRVGKPRGSPALPIRELFHASIAHVFVKHLATMKARVTEQLAKNVAHELRRAIRARS